MADKVKVGVIGSRFEADIHVASIKQMGEDAEVVAIASPTPGNAEKLAKQYGVPRWFTDYKTMLAERDIEMVTITAPNRLHCQMTIDIANAGKHVVCEKPLCMTLEEADIMIEHCAQEGRAPDVRRGALLHAEVRQGEGNGGPGRRSATSIS